MIKHVELLFIEETLRLLELRGNYTLSSEESTRVGELNWSYSFISEYGETILITALDLDVNSEIIVFGDNWHVEVDICDPACTPLNIANMIRKKDQEWLRSLGNWK